MSFFMTDFGRTPRKKLNQGSTEVNLVTIRSKCRVTIRNFTIISVTIRRFACINNCKENTKEMFVTLTNFQ